MSVILKQAQKAEREAIVLHTAAALQVLEQAEKAERRAESLRAKAQQMVLDQLVRQFGSIGKVADVSRQKHTNVSAMRSGRKWASLKRIRMLAECLKDTQ